MTLDPTPREPKGWCAMIRPPSMKHRHEWEALSASVTTRPIYRCRLCGAQRTPIGPLVR